MVRAITALVLTLGSATLMRADIAIATAPGAGAWYTGVPADMSPADAFWDNSSQDDSTGACNVGYWLQDASWPVSATCKGSASSFAPGDGGPGMPLNFFASAGSASTPVGFFFDQDPGITKTALRLEVSGLAARNIFGYYQTDATGAFVGPLVPLFVGGDDPNANNPGVKTFVAPSGYFGFYMCVGSGGGDTTCDSGLRLSGDPFVMNSHATGRFALFSEVPGAPGLASSLSKYWIGVENGGHVGPEGLGDYQDLLVSVQAVPEPGFYGMLALGMSGIFCVAIRRRRPNTSA
jgi:hypothetical protein